MTESHPLPFDPDAPPAPACTFDPDAPPAPACTFYGMTLRHTPAGPAWVAPGPRPAPAAGWEDIGAGPVYVYADRERARPDDPVYTLTTIRGQSGWNTDGGISGYGLTLAAALFYRDAANAAIAAGAVFPAEEGDA